MTFDPATIFTPDVVLFSLIVWAVTLTLRRLADALLRMKGWEKSSWWTDVFLPPLPVLVGIGLSLCIRGLPHPAGWDSRGARFLYGLLCGFFSGQIYRMIKGIVRNQWSGLLPTSSSPSLPSDAGSKDNGVG